MDKKMTIGEVFAAYPINVSGAAEAWGINPALLRAYKGGNTYISAERRQYIQERIRAMGRALAEIEIG